MKHKYTYKHIHYEIISYLNTHPFTSIGVAAKDLNYDRTTVSKRLKELKDQNILSHYTAYIRSECIGFPISAYIYIKNALSEKHVLDIFKNYNGTVCIRELENKTYCISAYFTTCEEAYSYLCKSKEIGDATLKIKLHAVEPPHPVFPPKLFKGAENLEYNPIGWRNQVPEMVDNLKLLSSEEMRFFKLISEHELPYNVKTFCDDNNFDIFFAEETIDKFISQSIIYGFDTQVNTPLLGLEYCENIIISNPTETTFNAIKQNQNIKVAYLMADNTLQMVIYAKDKEEMDEQLQAFAPSDSMERYCVKSWPMVPRNVLPQWVVDIKVD